MIYGRGQHLLSLEEKLRLYVVNKVTFAAMTRRVVLDVDINITPESLAPCDQGASPLIPTRQLHIQTFLVLDLLLKLNNIRPLNAQFFFISRGIRLRPPFPEQFRL